LRETVSASSHLPLPVSTTLAVPPSTSRPNKGKESDQGLEPWKARPPPSRANSALGHTRNDEAAFLFLLGRLLALLCLLLVLLELLLRAAAVVTEVQQQEAEEQP